MNTITQAFVLGAGLGTRLRPLTENLPKPLIPIFQKPLITFALDHLIDVGVERFVINTHKQAELFENSFRDNEYEGHSVTLVHEPDLLETGGGIKNVEHHLGSDPIVTYSGDILTDVHLQPLIDEHFRRGNDVTLALRETGLATEVALRDHRIVDIANRHGTKGNLDFANVAVWNSNVFQQIPPRQKISFIPIVTDWIGKGGKIGGLVMNDGKWFNIGSRTEYLDVHRMILREHWTPHYIRTRDWPERVAKSAIVDPSAQLQGCSVVGENCQVGAGAVLEDTILWPGAQIASKSQLHGCIVRSQKKSPARIVTATSSMRTDFLLRRTRMHFPLLDVADIKIRPIEKGGSDRKFYRIRCSPNQTLILVKYNLEREENRHYVEIAKFLEAHGIRAPKIYFHDATEGLIWIEDLGEQDLYSYRDDSWLVRRAFYESALDEIIKLHSLPESVCLEMKEHLPAEFNAALYRWEQRYFFNNCLGRYFKVSESLRKDLAALPSLREIAKRLASLPRVLVHRDFQSQNIIIQNGQANLIDFQGMRPGLAEYDLASLLFDPYVELSAAERSELISYYRQKQTENGRTVDGQFDDALQLCAMQRLMQALGAYGFLGLVRGHEHFLQYIPRAAHSLREIMAKIDDLKTLASLLGDLG